MKLDDAFERIFVINLPFKSDRRERLERHLAEIGIVTPGKVVWARGICGDWAPPPEWWGAGNGAWGCLMSHMRIGQDAVHDRLASYCVLEDDVVFHPRAPEMLECFMKELPGDWGQVYLGGQFLHEEPQRISEWVMKPYNVNRTHAFALARDTIPVFLQHIMHAPDYFDVRVEDGVTSFDSNCFHIDHQLGRAHERNDWRTYAPTWWLAGQEEGSSNISGSTNVRMWWHWSGRGRHLPFFYMDHSHAPHELQNAHNYLHGGYNLEPSSLVDVGIKAPLDDQALAEWLRMIAGEAMERWLLPGFQVPCQYEKIVEQAGKLWPAGVLRFEEGLVRQYHDYPFNGIAAPLSFGLSQKTGQRRDRMSKSTPA